MERLDKIISATGKKSRREVREMVRQGRVLVDGKPAPAADMKVDPQTAVILLDGEPLGYEKFTYVMLHKPAGVLTATEDRRQETVLDLLPPELRRRACPRSGGSTRIRRGCSCSRTTASWRTACSARSRTSTRSTMPAWTVRSSRATSRPLPRA